MSNKALHKRLTVNSFSNMFRYLVYMCVTFFLTPFIIRNIGDSHYGLWLVVISVIGYAGLLEMGIQSAVIKLVAEFKASGDDEKVNRTVVTSSVFFLMVGACVTAFSWLVLPHFLDYFVKDPAWIKLGSELVMVLSIDMLIVFQGYVFTGMIYGLQLYFVKNIIDIASSALYAALVYLFLTGGGGIFALAVIKTCLDALALVVFYILCRKSHEGFRFSLKYAGLATFRSIMALGGKIFTSATMARIANNADPLIITYFLSTFWASIFSIPKRLLDYMREITWTITTGFMPAFSDLHGRNDVEGIRSIYINYTRYILIATLPMLVMVFVYGETFIGLWISPEYAEKGRTVLYLLGAAFAVEAIQPLLWKLFIGTGDLNSLVKTFSITALAYIVLSSLFASRYGIGGLAASALVVSIINQIFYLRHSCRYLGVTVPVFLKECHLMPFAAAGAFGGAAWYLGVLFPVDSYLGIMAQAACAAPVYVLTAYFFTLKRHEKIFLQAKARGLLSFS